MKSIVAVSFGCLLAGVSSAIEKKIITYSWGVGSSTPAQLLERVADLEKVPVDGYCICFADVKRADGAWLRPDNMRFNARWQFEDFEPQVATVRELMKHKGFHESLLRGWSVLDKRVDWRDDEAWARFAYNFGVLAKLVRACGMKGTIIDHEDYHRIKQFFLQPDDGDYDTVAKLVRRRGAQVFEQAFRECPDMVVLSFWMLSLPFDERYCTSQPDLVAMAKRKGDLWPAFFNGILDVLPPEATLVDGCEHGYNYEYFRNDFYRGASLQRTGLLPLVAPENRRKYRAQLRAGFGLYAANYYNERSGKTRWYHGPRNGSRLAHWEANLNQAVEAADEYVWIFTERGTWIDWGLETVRARTRRKDCDFFPIESKVPGFLAAIDAVKDPVDWGRRRIADLRAKGKLVNLLENGEARQNDHTGYTTIRVEKIKPGEYYAYDVNVSGGAPETFLTTRFMKNEAEKEQVLWINSRDTGYVDRADGTRRGFDVVRVPDTGAAFLDAVIYTATTNSTKGVTSINAAGLYRLPLVD